MPAPSNDYAAYVLEQLEALPGITNGRLFGGVGLKAGDVQFAMIIDGTLYFVVDDSTRPKYEAMGSTCFAYNTKQRRVDVRRYFEVPADVLENGDELVAWADEAIAIATRTSRAKGKK
jgi:DNA transformation protein